MADDLGVGIIGAGNISAAYLQLAPMFKGYKIVAVADINMDNANARAAEFGVRAETVDGLLAADDVDLVINLTIPAAHVDVSRSILQAGKHVYSEKPFVLSLAEAQELGDIAKANNLRIGSAPDTFMGGSHQLARKLIDAGEIGTVASGAAVVMSSGMESWHPNPDFFFQKGGGPILDLGPYYICNLVQLLGPVAKVTSFTGAAHATRTIGNGARGRDGTGRNAHHDPCGSVLPKRGHDHAACQLGCGRKQPPHDGTLRYHRHNGCTRPELLWRGRESDRQRWRDV